MIKKIVLLILLCFSFITNAQIITKTFTINGQVEGDYSDYIYLRTLGAENIQDSCLVVDKKFKFSGKLEKVSQATLTLKSPSTVSFFYLENSIIEIALATSTFKEGAEDINDVEEWKRIFLKR